MGYIYNYNKLKGRIIEKLGSLKVFAQKMDWSEPTTYSKLSGKVEFKQSEILDACEVLDIAEDEIRIYFFYADKVKKNATIRNGLHKKIEIE